MHKHSNGECYGDCNEANAMAPMEKQAELVPLCFVPLCDDPGTIDIMQYATVRWPASQRELQGRIRNRAKVCEWHFEALARGEDVD